MCVGKVGHVKIVGDVGYGLWVGLGRIRFARGRVVGLFLKQSIKEATMEMESRIYEVFDSVWVEFYVEQLLDFSYRK